MRSVLLAVALASAGPHPAAAAPPVPVAAVPRLPVVPVPPPTPARKADAARVAPPSLSAAGLAAELREGSRRRAEELAALTLERQRLEALAAEIATARKALREDSARLERQIEQAKQADQTARARAQQQRDGAKAVAAGEPEGKGDPEGTLPKQVAVLAKTLKGMKPTPAAAMVAELPRPLAAAVLQKLKPADAAAMLSRMKSGDAAELFTMLSRSDAGANP